MVSAFDSLSALQQQALRLTRAESNLPVQLDDLATIERITALLRTTATANPARTTDRPQIESVQLKKPAPAPEQPSRRVSAGDDHRARADSPAVDEAAAWQPIPWISGTACRAS